MGSWETGALIDDWPEQVYSRYRRAPPEHSFVRAARLCASRRKARRVGEALPNKFARGQRTTPAGSEAQ